MPAQVYILAVMLSCKKIRSQEQIVIIPSWPLPWRQIRPCPLVVIAASHQLHQLLWLAEPLTVRVWVSIWGLSGLIRAGKETAERHVYHRAAHSTKGCKEYRQSRWWEGLSVIHSFSVHVHCSWQKQWTRLKGPKVMRAGIISALWLWLSRVSFSVRRLCFWLTFSLPNHH